MKLLVLDERVRDCVIVFAAYLRRAGRVIEFRGDVNQIGLFDGTDHCLLTSVGSARCHPTESLRPGLNLLLLRPFHPIMNFGAVHTAETSKAWQLNFDIVDNSLSALRTTNFEG